MARAYPVSLPPFRGLLPFEAEHAPFFFGRDEVTERDVDPMRLLVVEDEPETRLLYEKYLRNTAFRPIPAGSIRQAREQMRRHAVVAIVLDVLLPDEPAWQWLAELKREEATAKLPVLIVSSVEDPRKGLALGADDYGIKPLRRSWLLDRLQRVTKIGHDPAKGPPLVLIIDDQETAFDVFHIHPITFRMALTRSVTRKGFSIQGTPVVCRMRRVSSFTMSPVMNNMREVSSGRLSRSQA